MKKLYCALFVLAGSALLASCHCDCPDECECGGSCGTNCSCDHIINVTPLSASPTKFKDGEEVTFRLSFKPSSSVTVNGEEQLREGKVEYFIDEKLVAESKDVEHDFIVKAKITGFAVGTHKLTAKYTISGQSTTGSVDILSTMSFAPVTIYVK